MMSVNEMKMGNDITLSLGGHLTELRSRIFKALIALVLGVLLSLFITQQSLALLVDPVGGLTSLQAIEVTESVGVYFRIALLGGFIVAFPFILLQLIAFVSPGLKKSERKTLYFALPLAIFLFISGVLFTYLVMLPAAIPFLLNFMGIQTIPTISNYVTFVINMMFWIGLCFEMPLVFSVLAKIGIVTGSMLLKQWRIAIVIISVIAAVVSPTVDPVNMGLLMLPLFALYVLSTVLAFVIAKKGE